MAEHVPVVLVDGLHRKRPGLAGDHESATAQAGQHPIG